jgi:L-malate glycosyltransferase
VSDRRERITILAPDFPWQPGGGPRTFYEHANGLARRGYDVSVVHSLNLPSGPAGQLSALARDRVRGLRSGAIRRRIGWMPIDPKVKLVVVPRFEESTTLPAADLRVGTFWRTTEYLGAHPLDGAARMQLLQAYETFAAPADRIDAVWRLPMHAAVVSTALRDKGIELGVPASRLHVVPNGLDHAVFRPARPVRDRPPQLAFLAHETPIKGLAEAIEIAVRVHQARPEVPIVAFGGRARPRSIPAFIRYARGLSGPSLVEQVYDQTSVFLCASIREGFGFPSLEAMACGAALVSTRNGGVDDFAIDGQSALLADVGDIDGLTDSVLTLLAEPNRRNEIAENGRTASERFTWDASVDAFESAVRAALADQTVGGAR